jgi:hypothetical protein
MQTSLRTVPDTNVVVAAQSASVTSSNREYFERWKNEEFALLFPDDTLREYIEKLVERSVLKEIIMQLVVAILELGTFTPIQFFHLAKYPIDAEYKHAVMSRHLCVPRAFMNSRQNCWRITIAKSPRPKSWPERASASPGISSGTTAC